MTDAKEPATDEMLAPFVERIDAAYRRLDHVLGWRFLYTPAATLAPGTRLAFVGLNPGDAEYHPPIASSEAGNAYRLERWWGARQDGLQQQILRLYDGIAGQAAAEAMDATLALNFCPFRSPTWQALASPRESVAFSQAMWAAVLDICTPRAVVCLGAAPMRYLDPVLLATGATRGSLRRYDVGWGSVTYAVAEYATPRGPLTMVALPHLSRFRIFGRSQSRPATDAIVATLVQALA
jgi:hypothetical protein